MFFTTLTSSVRKDDKEPHDVFGYRFSWSPLHPTESQLRPLKFSYDRLCDDVYDRLVEKRNATPIRDARIDDPERSVPKSGVAGRMGDFYSTLEDEAKKGEDELVGKLWTQIHTIPDWVDWDQIERGQKVFYRYAGAALVGLAFSGLLGGMGAEGVVETLVRTGGFSPKVARKRMLETTQHALQCTMSLDSIKPGGEGHISSIRVRLLHSAVRKRIMALSKTKPEYYNAEKYGIPINDLDSIATILTFSTKLLVVAMPAQGVFPRPQEIEDYTALWRLIAWYMGTPTDPFATPELARAYLESITETEAHPSESGRILANNIIASLADEPPYYSSADFLRAQAWWLNGPALCKELHIPKPSLLSTSLTITQMIVVSLSCYITRSRPDWDEWKIQVMRERFYQIFVEGKHGLIAMTGAKASFQFQYIPEYSTVTDSGKTRAGLGILGPGQVERRYFIILLGLLATVTAFSYGSARLTFWLTRQAVRYLAKYT